MRRGNVELTGAENGLNAGGERPVGVLGPCECRRCDSATIRSVGKRIFGCGEDSRSKKLTNSSEKDYWRKDQTLINKINLR